jgi:hypothetical protein
MTLAGLGQDLGHELPVEVELGRYRHADITKITQIP